jgi:hypothetical protein
MFPGFLTEHVKITKIHDHTTAGTTDVTDAVTLDMSGYEGVVFLTSFGTAAADNSLKAQQSDDDGSSDGYSDIIGSGVVSGASPSNEDVILDIFRPQKRYVKAVVVVDTSSTVESIWAIQYKPRNTPITNSVSGTLLAEQHHAPAEGTA